MTLLLGLVWALAFGVPVSLLSWLRLRPKSGSSLRSRLSLRSRFRPAARQQVRPAGGAHGAKPVPRPAKPVPLPASGPGLRRVLTRLVISVVVLFVVDTLAFYHGRPMTTFTGLLPLIMVNLLIVLVLAAAGRPRSVLNAGSCAALLALVTFGVIWLVGHNSDHDSYAASHLVSVTVEPDDELPASSTDNMVIVSPDIATTKASQAMATGLAGQRNYSTYLQLGPATLQFVAGHMWYVFPLEFDGSGNKARLHAIMPGYIMVSAEDPDALPVEHYDGPYSMVVGLGGGQGSEPDRWAYDHGYSGYLLDDPTLEINDQGLPYYTVTLLRPRVGWTFMAPVGVLVINAHTGQITRYAIGAAPDWVDRVYSQQLADQIANWYGEYSQAGFQGLGSSNANRLKVSGDPIMVYTGTGHPVWRMLLTSYNSDSSVSRIVEMNSATGAMQVYTPQAPMGVENPVNQAFDNASGIGASLIKADHYQAVDLTLHVIYGHLTWMAIYEPQGGNPSFVGIGFADAYQATASNVVFGNSKETALQNYLTQLASEPTANGTAPEQGGVSQTFAGKIAAIGWDITGGQKYWYITLAGDPRHVYVGTVASVGPALVLAQTGDPVTITVLNVGSQESTRTMESFTDSRVPLQAAGS
jgi:multisubunit Na+/H+ antiporter MnhB subunit